MAPDESLPLYVQAHEIAEVTGWSSWRTINLLKKAGIAEKVGAYWCTTRHKLRDAFPDAYDALLDRIVARREASQRAKSTKRSEANGSGAERSQHFAAE